MPVVVGMVVINPLFVVGLDKVLSAVVEATEEDVAVDDSWLVLDVVWVDGWFTALLVESVAVPDWVLERVGLV